MTYNKERPILPFWAKSGRFIRGRDPLGIQNSSITVYGRLLPGMTNLTGRIRYYSFYCWLLNEYDQSPYEEEKKNYKEQYKIIRRAELLMAFLMVTKEPTTTNVPGINYATNNKDSETYSLSKGADMPGKDLYWKYSSGALGQYYAGSLISLGLIETVEGFFHITSKGKKVANAFCNAVPKTEREYYLMLVRKGECSKEDFSNITSFCLTTLKETTNEWEVLRTLLLESDGDNFRTKSKQISNKRAETITLFLRFKENSLPLEEFPLWVYNHISIDVDSTTSQFGWFYYYLNEAIHYSLSTIFWAFLSNAEGEIKNFSNYLLTFQTNILKSKGFEQVTSNSSLNKELLVKDLLLLVNNRTIPKKLSQLKESVKKKDSINAAGKSLLFMLTLYNYVKQYKEKIIDFEEENYINFQRGHLSENLSIYINNNLDSSLVDYIARTIKTILNTHLSVAYEKMANRNVNLLKFLVENEILIHIETMEPQNTNPRTQSLSNFLQDLGYLNSEKQLTEIGKRLIKETKNA